MNQNELTLGCYVLLNGENCQVDEITLNAVGLDGKESLYYTDTINPIPIDETVLGLMGFKKNKPDIFDIWSFDTGTFVLEVNRCSNSLGREWYLHVDNDARDTVGGGDIQYVHQLQGLLKILGVEFEFKL